MKESIARRKTRQPIPKRVSGDGSAPPRFLVAVNFAFRRLAKATRQLCSVTAPLPKKFCDTFWEPCFTWFFGHFSVCFSVACAWLRRAQRAALVIDKHTPRCQIHKFSRSRYKLNIYCSTLFFFKQRNRLFNVRLRTSFRNMYVKIFDCSATSNIIDSYKFI